METKKRRTKRTPESYRKEVEEITNGEYSVLGDFVNTRTKIKHLHIDCGTSWETSPGNFLRGSRCPRCANYGGLRRTHDQFVSEVFDLVGEEYSVLEPFTSMGVSIKFRHNYCGREYEASPKGFICGSRCHHCSKQFRMSEEDFKNKIFDLVGEDYLFLERFVKMKTHIRVKHKVCGYSYKVSPNDFIHSGARCPNCVYSRGEKAIADVLDSLSIEYSREHIFEYLGRKRFDFFIPSLNIAIEYDGEQHFKAVDHWGGEEALKRTQESDALKNDFCDFMGIDLLRIPYWEFDNIDEIVTNFVDTVKLMRSISANSSEMAKCR